MHIIFLVLKWLVALSFVLVLISLVLTAYRGIVCRSEQRTQARVSGLSLARHKKAAGTTFVLTILSILFTEAMVRVHGGPIKSNLFWIHLALAASYFVALCGLFAFNGRKSPKRHRVLAYITLVLYIGAFATGMTLLAQL